MPRLFEFLDPDGSCAIVRPLDDTRGRVVYSNVLEEGEILYKDPRLTWQQAGEDAGGHTRLGPSDFPPGSPKEGDLDAEDFHRHEEERVLFDLLESAEAPEPDSFDREPFIRALYPARGGGGDQPDIL